MSSFRVLVGGVPYGYQGPYPHGVWLTEDHTARIKAAGPDVEVLNPSVDDLNAGWLPDQVPHALLVETSGTNDSWDDLPAILRGDAFLRLLSDDTVFVQSAAAGVEHLTEVMPRSIPFCNASGVHAPAIAETVMAGILSRAKLLPQRREDQAQKLWRQLPAQELTGTVMCVLGTGHIGTAVAKLAKAFGMTTLGVRRSATPAEHFDEVFSSADLHAALIGSDFVVVACPATPETERMLAAEEFALMKPRAYVLNVSRGAIIDEPAMIEALQAERIGGAFLDCLVREPLPEDSPLWSLPTVSISPHDSHASQLLGDHHVDLFCENIRRATSGLPLVNQVDLDRGY